MSVTTESRAGLDPAFALIEHSLEHFFVVDSSWTVTYANAAASAAGRVDTLVGRHMWELSPDAYASEGGQMYRRVMETRQPDRIEYFSPSVGRWIDARAIPYQDGIAIFYRDLSKLRETQEEADRKQAIIQVVSDSAPALLSYVDREERYVFNNETYRTWFGQAPESIRGKTIREVLGEEAYEARKDSIQRALNGEAVNLTVPTILPDGRRLETEVSYTPHFKDGKVVGFAVLVRDISASRRTEQSLQQSLEQLEVAQQAAGAGAYDWDIVADTIHWTPTQYRLFGVEPGAFGGNYAAFRAFVHPDDIEGAEAAFQTALGSKAETFEYEMRIVRPSGQTVWISTRGRIYRDDDGTPTRLVGINVDLSKVKEVEEALRQSEMIFRQIANSMPQMVWTGRPDGYIDWANSRWCEYTGQTLEETQASGWAHALHPEDYERTLAEWTRAVSTGTLYQVTYRFKRASDGAYRWHIGRALPIYDNEGNITRWAGTCTDIHEEKQQERRQNFLVSLSDAMRAEANGFQVGLRACKLAADYFEASRLAFVLFSEDSDEIRVIDNRQETSECPAIKSVTDLDPLSVERLKAGRTLVVNDVQSELPGDYVQRVLAPQQVGSYIGVPFIRDGCLQWMLGIATSGVREWDPEEVRLAEDVAERIAAAVERSLAEEKLRASNRELEVRERTLRFLVELAEETRHIRDSQKIVSLIQRELCEHLKADRITYGMFDEDEDSFELTAYSPRLPNPAGRYKASQFGDSVLDRVRSGEVIVLRNVEKEHDSPEGAARYVSMQCRALIVVPVIRNGRLTTTVAVHSEQPRNWTQEEVELVTMVVDRAWSSIERVRAEASLRRLNEELERRVDERTAELKAANLEMEGFTYSVSHDLRTPLRAMVSNARILEDDFGGHLSEEAVHLMRRISTAANKMAQLVDDLLRLSRIGRQELLRRPVDLTALAKEVAAEVGCEDGSVTIEPELRAYADPVLVRLLLENLVGNCMKFGQAERPLAIQIGRGADGSFFVRDNGIGFDMQYAEKIFKPFERLHLDHEYPGTGIGLANVKRIVERHDGKVWAESVQGQGATFFFTLEQQIPVAG